MAEYTDLETRIRVLEDIEAIRKLKAKYFRCLDKRLWDEMADCFTEDAAADFGPDMQFQGRTAILQFLKQIILDSFLEVHQGHNAEIDIASDTTAYGIWELFNYLIHQESNSRLLLGSFYEDEYVKEHGKWKIRSTKEVYIFKDLWELGIPPNDDGANVARDKRTYPVVRLM